MAFQDHFSSQAMRYAAARPRYPAALFEWLAGCSPGHRLAWDAGCGNGQAARALAAHFRQVVASDPSAAQIEHAQPHPGVEYRVETAESSSLATASVDLACVAQALHWFDAQAFESELGRVLRPGGVFAAWCYGFSRVDPAVDAIVDHLYRNLLGAHWPPERVHIEDGYRHLPIPFETRVPTPAFAIRHRWPLERYLDYLRSWSASERYRHATGEDAVARIEADMRRAWGDPSRRRPVQWPVVLRLGRRPTRD